MNNSEFWVKHFSTAPKEINNSFIDLNVDSFNEILKEYDVLSKDGVAFEIAENRVFGFGDVIFKFYRPGRWDLEAIKDEVQFLNDLKAADVDTVRLLGDVGTWNGIHYLAYQAVEKPFIESPDVLDEEKVRKLSHLLARIHEVGKKRVADARPQFNPAAMCTGCFEVISRAGYLPKDLHARYEDILQQITNKLAEFKDVPLQRIHGDAYSGNVVWQSGNPIFLDFDDFQVGPKAMDLKLLSFPWRLESLPETMDKKERRDIQQQLVLDCYREVSEFPKAWEKMFPLVSAYRDVQFDAWFSARWSDPAFVEEYAEDDITTRQWWLDDIEHLEFLLS